MTDTIQGGVEYSSAQAEVLRLHRLFRDCILSQKYYARRLNVLKSWNLAFDITTAFSTSASFAGLAIWKTPIGQNAFTYLLFLAAVISVLRPIIKLAEGIDRYSKLHYAYAELALRIESLVADMRRRTGVQPEHYTQAATLDEQYRNLALQDDAGPSRKELKKFEDEVNTEYPSNYLWLPQA